MPAVTSFLGFGHALQRHVNKEAGSDDFHVHGVGIISHRFEMLDCQVGYSRLLRLSANPLNEHGERSSFIEEGRCHLTASLVIEVSGFNAAKEDLELLSRLIVSKMKLAGGDLVVPPQVENLVDDRKSIRKLMPGYALIERRDLMIEQMQAGDDGLDALHRYLQVQHRAENDGNGNVTWVARRQTPGWIVPIATGFHAVSPVAETLGARDPSTPHRFAESVVTLGEYILASRISSLSDLIWRYQIQGDLYVCVQEKSVIQSQQ
jgi:CRISPR-associated protein Csy2